MNGSTRRYDPILLEVLWNRLVSITEEQAQTLMRTGLTSILSDAGDLCACLFDSRARMVAQATLGTPGHINALANGLHHFLRHHPPETLEAGDVLISNNAYELSGHLYDFTIVTPAIRNGRVVGYFGSTCHVLDIGGRGLSTEGESIFEEGLYVPYLKYYRAGRISREIEAIIEGNSREPYKVLGDLRAQVVANEVAKKRLFETLDEFGLDEIDSLGDQIIEVSEAAMRKAIAAVPDGTYENEVLSDGFEAPIRVRCALTVRGDRIDVDFAGSSPASQKAINVCLNFTKAYTFFPVKAALAPDTPNNEGAFRPVRVSAPKGSILNAEFPMPTAARHSVSHFVAECVMGALYRVVPDKVVAESAAATWPLLALGEEADGRLYSVMAFLNGGMGARRDKDGISVMPFPSGARGTPIEILESQAPLVVHHYELRPDTGGAGRTRGGLGHVVKFGVRSGKPWRFPALVDRTQIAAQGVDGGASGALGRVVLNGTKDLASKGGYKLAPTDTVTFMLPGGGGYGPPAERDPALVLRDVIAGYVTTEAARDLYRVALVPDRGAWRIDDAETANLRSRRVQEWASVS